MGNQNNQNNQEVDINQLLKVRREKLANLQAEGKDPFVITKYNQTHHSEDAKNEYIALEEKLLAGRPEVNTDGMEEADARAAKKEDYEARRAIMDANAIHVSIAGRLMSKRVMGKASFGNVQDRDGNIQLYVSRDGIGEEAYADFKKYDVGDIVGIEGYVFRTMMGEISVHVEKITLLTKSLQTVRDTWISL